MQCVCIVYLYCALFFAHDHVLCCCGRFVGLMVKRFFFGCGTGYCARFTSRALCVSRACWVASSSLAGGTVFFFLFRWPLFICAKATENKINTIFFLFAPKHPFIGSYR